MKHPQTSILNYIPPSVFEKRSGGGVGGALRGEFQWFCVTRDSEADGEVRLVTDWRRLIDNDVTNNGVTHGS